MGGFSSNSILKRFVPAVLLSMLLWLGYAVMQEFFVVITTAIIIAYVMWPLFLRVKAALKNHVLLSAIVMTGSLAAGVSLTLYWLIDALQGELMSVYQTLLVQFSHLPKQLPESILRFPWLSQHLQQALDQLNTDQSGIKTQALAWAQQGVGQAIKFLGGVGRHMLSFVLILATLFFCFRDGEQVVEQLKRGFRPFLGSYQTVYLQAAGDTAQAVVYGLVFAAIAQGIIAGVGYSVAGVNAPALLGAITAIFAMVPMGAPLVWLPIGIGLIALGNVWQGTGLLLWGIFVISTIDNVVRPLVISGAGRIPFLVVLFGVFGGLKAFGFAGLFLGPIILSVSLAVWRAWLKQQKTMSNESV